jgi:hypothetical protein
VIGREPACEYHSPVMAIHDAPAETPRRRRAPVPPIDRGYLALTAALYPDGDAVCAEILEFGIASEGDDFDHAYAMIIEAVEGLVEVVHAFPPDSLERFVSTNHLTVYPAPPATYRPAAIPSHLLSQPGLILRPVSISIEAAIRG